MNVSSTTLILGPSIGAGTGNFLLTASNPTLNASSGIPANVTVTMQETSGFGSLSSYTSTLTNNGTLSLISANGSYASLSVSTLFTNNGVFSISAGGTQSTPDSIETTLNNGTVNLSASTTAFGGITNAGVFNIASGQAFTDSQGFNQSAGILNINGSFASGNFNFAGGSINGQVLMNVSSSTLSLGPSIGTGTGKFLLTASNPTLNASSGIPTNVTVTMQETSGFGSLSISTPGLTNNGTLSLIAANGSYAALSLSSLFTNNGIFSISAAGAQSTPNSLYGTLNNGTVNINANTSAFSIVSNAGVFNIAPGQLFTAGPGFNQAGGTLNINGSFAAGNFNFSGGSINGQVLMNTSSSTLTLGPSIGTGTGNFLLSSQNPTLNASSGIPANVTVTLQATGGIGSLSSYTSSLTNNGTLALISANGSYASLSVSTLFTNNGTFSVSAAGTQSTPNSIPTTVNNGTINFNAITTASGGITNSGIINIAAGQSLTYSRFNQAAGSLNVNGSFNPIASESNFFDLRGGTVTVANTLTIPNSAPAVPLNFIGGSLVVGAFNTSGVPANFNWTGGTLTINGSNPLIESSTASPFGANLSLSNGKSFVAGGGNTEIVGLIATGGITQTGGTNTGTASLNLGGNTGISGSYSLSGSGTLNIAASENIGVAGQGVFSQSGGINTAATIVVGSQSTASGLYTLSAGGLNLTGGLFIGQSGNGTFNQSGGTQVIAQLGLGAAGGGVGIAYLTGGSVNVSGSVGVGGTATTPGGIGTLNVSGSAVVSITGGLTVFDSPLNSMSIGPGGGSLSAASITLLGGVSTVSSAGMLAVGSGGILFTGNDSPTLAVNGGTVTLNGDVTFTGTGGTADILSSGSGTVDLGATIRTFNISQGSASISMLVSANLSDGSLVKIGPGTLLLAGADSFAGSANVSAGTLELGNPLALSQASGTLIALGGTLDLNGQAIGNDPLTLYGTGVAQAGALINSNSSAASLAGAITLGSTVALGGFGPITLSGNIGGSGGISKIGFNTVTLAGGGNFSGGLTVNSGTLAITAPMSFTGGVTLNGGVLSVSADADLGDSSNAIILSTGGTLEASGTFPTSRTFNAAGGTLSVDLSQTLTIHGTIIGGGPLNKSGTGIARLTSASTFSGILNVSAGTFSLSGPNGSLPDVAAVNITTSGVLELNSAINGNQVSQDRINNLAPITLAGGTLSLLGSNTATTTETLGQLILLPGASTISVTAGTGQSAILTFASLGPRSIGGTLDFEPSTGGQIFFTSGVANGAHLGGWATVNGTDFAKYSTTTGVIPFASSDYTFNAFTGPDVQLTSAWPGGNIGNTTISTLNLNCSAGNIALNQSTGSTLTLNAGGLLKQGSGSATISGGILTSSSGELDVSVNGAGNLSINSALTGAFVLAERGSGTLVLGGSSANTYTGFTLISGNLQLDSSAVAIPGSLTIDGGTVTSLASHQLATTANVVINYGTWNLNGQTETTNSLSNFGGTMLFNGGTLTVTNGVNLSGGTTTIASTLNSAALITVSGGDNEVHAGALVTTGELAFIGSASPAVQVDSDGTNPGRIVIDAGGTLSFTGTGTATLASIGTAALPGVLDLNGSSSHVVTIAPNALLQVSTTVTNGGFSVGGGGTLELMTAGNYSGGSTINTATTLMAANPAALGPADRLSPSTAERWRCEAIRPRSPSPMPPSSPAPEHPAVSTSTGSPSMAHPPEHSRSTL